MALCIKENGYSLPLSLIVFGRAAVTTVMLFALMIRQKKTFKSKNIKLLSFRCIVGTISMWLTFYAVTMITFAESSILRQSAPLWVSLVAWLKLKEQMSGIQRGLMVLGFLSVFLIFYPKLGGLHPGMFAALGGGMLSAFAYSAIRALKEYDDSMLIAFYFALSCTISAAPFFSEWDLSALTAKHMILLILSGFFGGVAQLWMTKAYHLFPAGYVSAFNYSSSIFSASAGFFIYNENLEPIAWLGGAMLIAIGVVFYNLKMPTDKLS